LYPALDTAFDKLDPDVMEDDETAAKIEEALDAVIESLRANPDEPLQRAIKELRARRHRTVTGHPLGGIVLTGKRRLHQFDPTFTEPDDSWESSLDRPYPLQQHCCDVANRVKSHAKCSGVSLFSTGLELAGVLHDAGKADPRFQAWLHGGNIRRAEMCGVLYAKSVVPFTSHRELTASRDWAGYPAGGRHELASVRLAECDGALPADLDTAQRDLILHLIAAHHGYCRPFAPVVEDPQPGEVVFNHRGRVLRTPNATGLERLDSGIAERFWMLTRRYGWWGLPYLEALLRLADWACGEPCEPDNAEDRTASSDGHASVGSAAMPEVIS
jgi:CRISPR-associated endonuclease/helicase Cas3